MSIMADVGTITRDKLDGAGTPHVRQNGSWHRDVVLEEVGNISGVIDMDQTRHARTRLDQRSLGSCMFLPRLAHVTCRHHDARIFAIVAAVQHQYPRRDFDDL